MNTVLKGNNFENECYILVNRMLNEFKLGFYPSMCKVFQKKGYYSRDRKKNIIFDIAVEVWPEGSNNYTMLALIECKDYDKKLIPVDDVEEFHSKIQQVTGVNVKGIFISKQGYQKGAYNFAHSKGMMLISANNNITYNIILYKAERYRQINEERKFTVDEDFQINESIGNEIIKRRVFRTIENKVLQSILMDIHGRYGDDQSVIPILSRSDIVELVDQLITSFDVNIKTLATPLRLEEFIVYLKEVYELNIDHVDSLGFDESSRPILARCVFTTNTIEIASFVRNSERYNFILAHEIGHYFLHKKTSISNRAYEKLEDSSYNFSINKHEIKNERGWVEWQANVFASNLLLPLEPILMKMRSIQARIGLRPGKILYVDQQKCNQDDFHTIIRELAFYFQTTKTSIIYRLEEISMLKIENRTRTVGQIIRNNYPDILS